MLATFELSHLPRLPLKPLQAVWSQCFCRSALDLCLQCWWCRGRDLPAALTASAPDWNAQPSQLSLLIRLPPPPPRQSNFLQRSSASQPPSPTPNRASPAAQCVCLQSLTPVQGDITPNLTSCIYPANLPCNGWLPSAPSKAPRRLTLVQVQELARRLVSFKSPRPVSCIYLSRSAAALASLSPILD